MNLDSHIQLGATFLESIALALTIKVKETKTFATG